MERLYPPTGFSLKPNLPRGSKIRLLWRSLRPLYHKRKLWHLRHGRRYPTFCQISLCHQRPRAAATRLSQGSFQVVFGKNQRQSFSYSFCWKIPHNIYIRPAFCQQQDFLIRLFYKTSFQVLLPHCLIRLSRPWVSSIFTKIFYFPCFFEF